MCNWKKAVTLLTVLGLCLSITCVGFAGHRKHKEKKNKQTSVTVVNENKDSQEVGDGSTKGKVEGTTEAAQTNATPPPKDICGMPTTSEPMEVLPYVLADAKMGNLQIDNANMPVYDTYTVLERREKGMATAMPDLKPYRNGKIAYLTFDDGPEGKNTPAILDTLKKEGVKGTFYVIGNQCSSYPQILMRMLDEGHAIGNHSYSHDYDVLYPYVDNFMQELYKTEKILLDLVGFRPLIVRAPGGTSGMFTSAYYPAIKAAGYVEHDWNVCIDDSIGGHPTAADFVQKVREQTASGISSAIVLMHCTYGKEETVKALPEIIQLLRERGYAFGLVTPMTPQAW